MEDAHTLSALESEAVKLEEDEFWPLSDKPYFDVVLSKSNFGPRNTLYLPSKMLQYLPPGPCKAPAVLAYRGKSWNVTYHRSSKRHFLAKGWRVFLIDNNLNEGDACVFELSECNASEVKFRVQILRCDFPSELLEEEAVDTPGTTVVID